MTIVEADLKCFDVSNPAITVMVDETRCATRLAHDHRDLYAVHTRSQEQ